MRPLLGLPLCLPLYLLLCPAFCTLVAAADPAPQTVRFSDRDWIVKGAPEPMGPGPNRFARENVRVDEAGKLHLSLVQRDGKWTCAEVSTAEPTGYGTYTFQVTGPLGKLDRYVVLGLFTWNNHSFATDANSEIDIEVARWGIVDPKASNLFYTVQPLFGPDDPSGRYAERNHGTTIRPEIEQSTHVFTWTPTEVVCISYEGHGTTGREIARWRFDGQSPSPIPSPARRAKNDNGQVSAPVAIPKPGDQTRACINLWLMGVDGAGAPPTDGKEVRIVIDRFEYAPLKS